MEYISTNKKIKFQEETKCFLNTIAKTYIGRHNFNVNDQHFQLSFFIKLYQITSDYKYLENACEIGDIIIKQINISQEIQYLTPSLSALIELFSVSGHKKYLIHASFINALESNFINMEYSKATTDFIQINLIPIHLRLYKITKDISILHKLNLILVGFFKRGYLENKKVQGQFDEIEDLIERCLIRDIFEELAFFFENQTFKYVAQNIAHKNRKKSNSFFENQNLDVQFSIQAILQKSYEQLYINSHLNSLDNLTVTRLINYTRKKVNFINRKEVINRKIINQYIFASISIKAFYYSQNEYYLESSRKAIIKLMRSVKHTHDNILSDITELVFKILSPEKFNHNIYPRIESKFSKETLKTDFPLLDSTIPEVKKRVISNRFPKTIAIIDRITPISLHKYFNNEVCYVSDEY